VNNKKDKQDLEVWQSLLKIRGLQSREELIELRDSKKSLN